MKIGIFGGSFDPIHLGHVQCAADVFNEFSLEKIIFVPVKVPVHKADTSAPPLERLKMIEIALANHANFETSDIEITREEGSYSLLTVRSIEKHFPGSEFYFILGTDSFNTLMTWLQPEEIVRICKFIVLRRKNHPIDEKLARWAGNVLEAGNTLVDISSTDVRNSVKNGIMPQCMDPGVWNYIIERGLYR